jgi:hypothetical protein
MTMRLASWLLIACCALAAMGVFFPAIEARPAVTAHVARIAHRTTLSLYDAAADRELARRLLAVYRASHGQRVGMQVLSAMEPRAHGRVKDALDDVHDAMDTLGGISDSDAKAIGTAVAAAIGAFLALEVLAALLVLGPAVGGTYRGGRVALALVLALLGAALGVAMAIACKQVVFEINDEVSYAVAELGAGAWLVPVGAVGAFVAAIALLVARRRAPDLERRSI